MGAVVAPRTSPRTGTGWTRWSAQLVGRERLNDRVVAVTDLVVREEGRVVAAGQLRVDGATAAVESVMTDPDSRGRGHADALLARALELAADGRLRPGRAGGGGRRLAAAWYARRGFDEVGRTWSVHRPACGPAPAQTGARTDSSR